MSTTTTSPLTRYHALIADLEQVEASLRALPAIRYRLGVALTDDDLAVLAQRAPLQAQWETLRDQAIAEMNRVLGLGHEDE